jgi:hypothetical protein
LIYVYIGPIPPPRDVLAKLSNRVWSTTTGVETRVERASEYSRGTTEIISQGNPTRNPDIGFIGYPRLSSREVGPREMDKHYTSYPHDLYFYSYPSILHDVPREARTLYMNPKTFPKVLKRRNHLILGVILPLFPPAGVSWPMIILSPGVVGTA